MTDSPAFRAPLDPEEQPILDSLLGIRDKLLLLKSDKSNYVKSQDVVLYYDRIIEQVHALNKVRTHKRHEQNRLDTVLDDCFQLISLFFLTIGRNNEAPAAYAVSSTIKRLLDHLKEAGFFTMKDLTGIDKQLEKTKQSVERGRAKHNEHVWLLLDARIHNCETTLAELKLILSQLSPQLTPTHEKLVSILRSMSGLSTKAISKATFDPNEVMEYKKQLLKIEANLEGHPTILPATDSTAVEQYITKLRTMSYDVNAIPSGDEIVIDLLARCRLWSEIILSKKGKLADGFKDQFDNLFNIRNQLEKLALTQAWSLRETDLYSYQRKLDRADESRVDGQFVDAHGQTAELYEQRTLLYLLRKSYAQIYFMITSSEPVSEALLPIYNQLMTLRKCLVEVKRSGGISSPRELYPYSMKLNSIDNMRVDGKFVVNGDIPEGQGSVAELLSECFELAFELRELSQEQEANDSSDQSGPEAQPGLDRTASDRSAGDGPSVSVGVK